MIDYWHTWILIGILSQPNNNHDPNNQGRFQGGGAQGHAPPPQSAKISKQIGPHFGEHPASSQYATLPNRKILEPPMPTTTPIIVIGLRQSPTHHHKLKTTS